MNKKIYTHHIGKHCTVKQFISTNALLSDKNLNGLLNKGTFTREILDNSVTDIESLDAVSAVHNPVELITENDRLKDSNDRPAFNGAVQLTRLQYEEEIRNGRLIRNENLKGTKFCQTQPVESYVQIITKSQPAAHPDHPLNHLAELEEELFPLRGRKRKNYLEKFQNKLLIKKAKTVNEETCDLLSRSPERLLESDQDVTDRQGSFTPIAPSTEGIKSNSLWDVKIMPQALMTRSSNSSTVDLYSKPVSLTSALPNAAVSHVITKKKKDYSKNFVMILNSNELTPLTDILANRATSDMLTKQFPAHHRGTPCRTLYIKNLPRDCSATELVQVFGNFDTGSERIVYRILSGRMKGQAFVRLDNVDVAERVIDTCHGYILKGKPLVIAYGKNA